MLAVANEIGCAPPQVSLAGPAVTHAPEVHTWLLAHELPHPPQLRASLERLTQLPPQNVVPGAHTLAQLPLEHAVPGPQLRPHDPQLPLLLARLVSHPLAAEPSQSPKPGTHAAMPHAPPAHIAVAKGSAHA